MKLSANTVGSISSLRKTLNQGKKGGNPLWIKNIPKEGITVRFLTEPEKWVGYSEYWEATDKTFIPMVEGEVLPDGVKPSFRYLAVVLDVEEDRVVPMKLPKTIVNKLAMKYDKYNTIMDRDYELEKYGEGLSTTYDTTPTAPVDRNLDKYELLDLMEVLMNARASATGEEFISKSSDDLLDEIEEVEEDEESAESEASEEEGDYGKFDYDELFPGGDWRFDYSEEELKTFPTSDLVELCEWWEIDESDDIDDLDEIIKAILEAQASAEDEEESEDDSEESEESEEDEYVVYEEDDLRNMRLNELRRIAEDLGIVPEGLGRETLISEIIETAEE